MSNALRLGIWRCRLTFDFSAQRNRILTGEADPFHEE